MTTVKIQSVPYGSRGETTKTLKELLKTSVPEIRKAISNGRAMEYNYKTLTELQVIHEYREKPTRMFQENIYGLASLTLTQINKIKTLNLIIIGSKGRIYSFSKKIKTKSGPPPGPIEKLFKRVNCSFSPEIMKFFEYMYKKNRSSRSGFITKALKRTDEFREFQAGLKAEKLL